MVGRAGGGAVRSGRRVAGGSAGRGALSKAGREFGRRPGASGRGKSEGRWEGASRWRNSRGSVGLGQLTGVVQSAECPGPTERERERERAETRGMAASGRGCPRQG